ncbi:recombinase family protein [Otoolea muris]|uniref:recombinase family protein n=1 Tax=Otoolea muris TaxID=2941515 RepID=UPI00203FFB89|nr:recombinase family protein [Otoolea muris]
MGEIYAYCRIVPGEADIGEQTAVMREMQVEEDRIFADVETEEGSERLKYRKLLNLLRPGDLLYIRNLSALGDSYPAIREQWGLLTKIKRIDLSLLEMPLVDTRRGKLQYGSLIADLVLDMLDYVSEADKAARRRRQREGIEKAKREGTRFGRSPLPTPDDFSRVYKKWASKEINVEEAARLCGFSRGTFYRRVKQIEKRK